MITDSNFTMKVPQSSQFRYAVVSPVKDEARFVEKTILSMVGQTIKPVQWVIVDDGSTDATAEIIEKYARSHKWIRVLKLNRGEGRQPGSAVIRAFATGYELIAAENFDFIVKLDCDLDVPPDYFERLLTRFQEDENLGIASGVYLEETKGKWNPIIMPLYHAAGASKVMRRKCFTDIGGFIPSRGWDTVDEIRAQYLGWTTRHFTDLEFRHLKKEGIGIGRMRTNSMHGEIYFLTGGGVVFFLFKALHRAISGRPLLLGGLAMMWGYFKSWITGRKKLVMEPEAKRYRQMLNNRLWAGVARKFRKGDSREEAWT